MNLQVKVITYHVNLSYNYIIIHWSCRDIWFTGLYIHLLWLYRLISTKSSWLLCKRSYLTVFVYSDLKFSKLSFIEKVSYFILTFRLYLPLDVFNVYTPLICGVTLRGHPVFSLTFTSIFYISLLNFVLFCISYVDFVENLPFKIDLTDMSFFLLCRFLLLYKNVEFLDLFLLVWVMFRLSSFFFITLSLIILRLIFFVKLIKLESFLVVLYLLKSIWMVSLFLSSECSTYVFILILYPCIVDRKVFVFVNILL